MDKPPSDSEQGDMAYNVAKAVVASVSMAGGALSKLYDIMLKPPLERRKQAWLEILAGVVSELEGKVADLTPQKLSKDEAFITMALHASQIELRTHQ